MRSFLPIFAFMAPLVACGGGDRDAGTLVFKSLGTLQCASGGVSLAVLQDQLAAANVQAVSAACGTDGLVHTASCGSSDGKIGIFEIAPTQARAAAAAGFTPLNTLPSAKATPCA
jgi:hypothetical protein